MRRSDVCGCSGFCAFAGRLLVFIFLASLCDSIGEPFWESFFQHQSSGWELFLVRGADCASPLSCRVCVCSQRGDERVEDILEEGDHRWTIRVVVRESDLEAEDGIGIRAWEFHRGSAKRARWYATPDGEGDTFAHEQHSRPQQRLLGHRRYVQTLRTGVLQTGAALASLSVILRERSMNPDARNHDRQV